MLAGVPPWESRPAALARGKQELGASFARGELTDGVRVRNAYLRRRPARGAAECCHLTDSIDVRAALDDTASIERGRSVNGKPPVLIRAIRVIPDLD